MLGNDFESAGAIALPVAALLALAFACRRMQRRQRQLFGGPAATAARSRRHRPRGTGGIAAAGDGAGLAEFASLKDKIENFFATAARRASRGRSSTRSRPMSIARLIEIRRARATLTIRRRRRTAATTPCR